MEARLPIKAPNQIIPFTDPRIRYPMYESQKFDGFRCLVVPGQLLLTASLKPHANLLLLSHFKDLIAYSDRCQLVFDGEIYSSGHSFSQLSSILRSHGAPIPASVKFHMFDCILDWRDNHIPYKDRYTFLQCLPNFENVIKVTQTLLHTAVEAESQFNERINANQEGSILRSPDGLYKHGRCTHRESNMFKFKNFITEDAPIVALQQRKAMRDDTIREIDPLTGRLKPIHTQDSFDLVDSLGAFIVSHQGQQVTIAPGSLTHAECRNIWRDYKTYPTTIIGHHIEFSYMPHGTLNKPRMGKFARFRADKD